MCPSTEWARRPLDEELLREVQSILAGVHDVDWPVGRAENS